MCKTISADELINCCWWCGKQVKGFHKELGRDMNPYHEHFCDLYCEEEYMECMDGE